MSVPTKMPLTKGRKKECIIPEGRKRIPWREVASKRIREHTEIGLMVRGGRFKAGLTQKQLAEKIGLKPHHISEIEHGKRSVDKKLAQKLAKVFNVDYRVFL